jgi:Family of unknown function (DUF5681)
MGYKQPPINRQFQKGRSGNPHGRPKGSGNFSSLMDEVLGQPMRVKFDGRQVVVSAREALGIALVERAVAGDVRIARLLWRYGFFAQSDEPMILWLSESDRNV